MELNKGDSIRLEYFNRFSSNNFLRFLIVCLYGLTTEMHPELNSVKRARFFSFFMSSFLSLIRKFFLRK